MIDLIVEPSKSFSSLEDRTTILARSGVERVKGRLGGRASLVASDCQVSCWQPSMPRCNIPWMHLPSSISISPKYSMPIGRLAVKYRRGW